MSMYYRLVLLHLLIAKTHSRVAHFEVDTDLIVYKSLKNVIRSLNLTIHWL
jgi:hypothetical protein